jgi:hypothetical protein
MLKGANVLLERLCSCFEYGGEEFQNVDPYDVQFYAVQNVVAITAMIVKLMP